jgi:hypothetical protein
MSPPAPGPPSRGAGASVGGPALALAGVLLGLVALGSARTAVVPGAPGVRLALRVPDALVATALGLLAAAAALLLLWLVQGRRRRRTPGDDEAFQLYVEPSRLSPWAAAGMLALALLPLVLLVSALRIGRLPALDWPGPASHPRAGVSGPGPAAAGGVPPPPAERPVVAAPAIGRTLGLLLLLAAVGSLALTGWLWLGDRAVGRGGRPGVGPPPAGPLIEAIEESLEALQREPDARRAIILCYRRFERWLGDCGVPRAPWETPGEFLRRALGRLRIPPSAPAALTRLFERSRFSHHALGAAERDAAVRALGAIRTALEARRGDAPAA